jgi:catechol 2,3-dioxygenase-like lactoylglutathione lyase family enzyme
MPRIAEVALFTADVPRLTAFYERVLGRPPDSSSESHASFDLGGTTLFIHVKGNGVEGAPDEDHIAFADVGEVADAKDFYWGRSAYVRDPDGRAIELQASL